MVDLSGARRKGGGDGDGSEQCYGFWDGEWRGLSKNGENK